MSKPKKYGKQFSDKHLRQMLNPAHIEYRRQLKECIEKNDKEKK